jgi:uncharacterized membrane protein
MNDDKSQPPDLSRAPPIVQRIQGDLYSIRTVLDESGKVVERIITPLMVELRFRDVCQILVGACVLAFPLATSEEVWTLGRELAPWNILGLMLISIGFIALFAYFLFYRQHLKGNGIEFIKRVAAVYLLTMLVSAGLLTLLERAPWTTEPIAAFQRTVLVTFPACFSATVVDSMK